MALHSSDEEYNTGMNSDNEIEDKIWARIEE